jgi:DNA-directed RNA polymerase sigma subunit (sigma70/sigma32)
MVKFEELLEKLQAGDRSVYDKVYYLLKDREITILREYYGIGCHPKPAEEIGDMFGLEENEVIQILEKTKAKIEAFWN